MLRHDDAMTNATSPRPFNPNDAMPILPTHISDTIAAIAKFHADHERAASPVQRLFEKTTEWFAKPRFVGGFTVFVASWICVVLFQMRYFGSSFDPPPFNLLQGVLTVLAVYMTALILSTQRRAGVLASHREQLTLELATLAEQKSAKTIALLEEMRRDNPMLPNRVDEDADAMAQGVDPEAVLQSIIDTQAESIDAVDRSSPDETTRPPPTDGTSHTNRK
jgi:uncharacterized membrane protein